MTIRVQDGLPYVTITLRYRGQQLELLNVLLDTGSAGTVFSADQVFPMGLQYEADDPVHRIRGIGGAEFVFSKRVDRLSLGKIQVNDFVIEVGAMDYGIDMDGIVGMDFLMQVGALIDLSQMEVRQTSR
jgi:predicted aspartyl protease